MLQVPNTHCNHACTGRTPLHFRIFKKKGIRSQIPPWRPTKHFPSKQGPYYPADLKNASISYPMAWPMWWLTVIRWSPIQLLTRPDVAHLLLIRTSAKHPTTTKTSTIIHKVSQSLGFCNFNIRKYNASIVLFCVYLYASMVSYQQSVDVLSWCYSTIENNTWLGLFHNHSTE